jgi:hypothetical protein
MSKAYRDSCRYMWEQYTTTELDQYSSNRVLHGGSVRLNRHNLLLSPLSRTDAVAKRPMMDSPK